MFGFCGYEKLKTTTYKKLLIIQLWTYKDWFVILSCVLVMNFSFSSVTCRGIVGFVNDFSEKRLSGFMSLVLQLFVCLVWLPDSDNHTQALLYQRKVFSRSTSLWDGSVSCSYLIIITNSVVNWWTSLGKRLLFIPDRWLPTSSITGVFIGAHSCCQDIGTWRSFRDDWIFK